MSPRPRTRSRVRAPRIELSSCREIIVLDSSQLRKKALQDCKRARTTFEKAELELSVYESEDVPAYHRWFRVQFGPMIEQGRDIQQKIQEIQVRMQRIGSFAGLKGCSFREAADFLERDPKGFEAEGERMWKEHQEREEQARRRAEEQHKMIFGQILDDFRAYLRQRKRSIERRLSLGREAPSDIAYSLQCDYLDRAGLPYDLSLQFFECGEMTDLLAEFGLPNSDEDEEDGDDDLFENLDDMFKSLGAENPFEEHRTKAKHHDAARFKALRRELAFALHPDQGGAGDPRKLELWHQVQEAIEAKDIDRLEVLHAHVQDMQGELEPQTAPIYSIRKLTQMYRSSREALRRKLRGFKKSREWGFSKTSEKHREKLEKEITREIRDELRMWRRELEDVERQYRQFVKAAPRREPDLFGYMNEPDEDDIDDLFSSLFR